MVEVVFYSRRTGIVYRRTMPTRREAEDRLRRLGMNRVPDTENVWQSKTYFAKIRENR